MARFISAFFPKKPATCKNMGFICLLFWNITMPKESLWSPALIFRLCCAHINKAKLLRQKLTYIDHKWPVSCITWE